MTEPLCVLVADDHAPTRAGIRGALVSGGFEVVAAVPDAVRALEAARTHRPDVCLLDIHMPGNGIVAAAEIAAALPDTAIVMLTASRDDDDLFDALRAGASGYLLKDMDPDRLAPALRGVLAGEAALPRSLMAKVVKEFAARPARRGLLRAAPKGERLTRREEEVLELMADGLGNTEIAQRLSVSPVTVRTYVAAILRKLRVPDRGAAIRVARGKTG